MSSSTGMPKIATNVHLTVGLGTASRRSFAEAFSECASRTRGSTSSVSAYPHERDPHQNTDPKVERPGLRERIQRSG